VFRRQDEHTKIHSTTQNKPPSAHLTKRRKVRTSSVDIERISHLRLFACSPEMSEVPASGVVLEKTKRKKKKIRPKVTDAGVPVLVVRKKLQKKVILEQSEAGAGDAPPASASAVVRKKKSKKSKPKTGGEKREGERLPAVVGERKEEDEPRSTSSPSFPFQRPCVLDPLKQTGLIRDYLRVGEESVVRTEAVLQQWLPALTGRCYEMIVKVNNANKQSKTN
jgi:hypothetical protein